MSKGTRGTARLNDKTFGTCCHPAHKGCVPMAGRIVTASSDVICNNRGVARLGDKVLPDCGHEYAPIVTSGSMVIPNFKGGTARLNDKVQGSYYTARIVTASSDTFPNP